MTPWPSPLLLLGLALGAVAGPPNHTLLCDSGLFMASGPPTNAQHNTHGKREQSTRPTGTPGKHQQAHVESELGDDSLVQPDL